MATAFRNNFRIPDLNITLGVGTLHSVYERSVLWQTQIALDPLNEKSE